MLPEARDKRVNYDLNMPSPPKPRRRGPLEFYEWIALMIFLILFGAAIATHIQLEAGSAPSVREDTNTLTYIDAVAAFFFLLLVVFDTLASRRYSMYSDELLTQWKDDKLRFMRMYSEEMERRAIDGKKSKSAKKK
ncbi:MAG: hypothetical protein CL695_05685 [Chloroflexi bacterium]|jgi:hypothetical protein|nr:hypothetical protein [Chloroflexota bacterium]HIH78661.1 hypothetical protein [Candidatus Poseidoniia archaeon]|tara:strand:- start:808 stop:1215 length:408 start_codon:yes stop_codon:yes gene_type:complete